MSIDRSHSVRGVPRGDGHDHRTGTVDANVYRDDARFGEELNRVIKRSWVLACHSSEIADPGSFFVLERLDASLVVVRQLDGSVAAFHNVCQHRGSRLLSGCGRTDGSIVCRFHGFGYDLAGSLVAVPFRSAFDADVLRDLSIPAVPVAEHLGWVWVNLTGAGRIDTTMHPAIAAELDWYDMPSWRVVRRETWPVAANWKSCVDAFLESWHVPCAHKSTVPGRLDITETEMRMLGRDSMMLIPSSDQSAGSNGPTSHHDTCVCHYLVFPTTMFTCWKAYTFVYSVWPEAVGRTAFEVVMLEPPSDPSAPTRMASEAVWNHFTPIMDEDVSIAEGIAASPLGHTRNIFNSFEARLVAFHDTIERELAESTAAG